MYTHAAGPTSVVSSGLIQLSEAATSGEGRLERSCFEEEKKLYDETKTGLQ